jgi:4-hydroxybenzoate polyprenyltransferase
MESSSRFWSADTVRALRPHQWLKNLLIAVPAVAAHNSTLQTAKTLLFAFVAYSLCASATYIVNDLLDRQYDRIHPRKKARPVPSGKLTVVRWGILAGYLLVGSIAISLFGLPSTFLLVLGGYFALTLGYSIYIKRLLMMDVVVLACLYGLRVIAGGVAVSITLSPWLIGFCIFFFLSLALVKRIAELKTVPTEPGIPLAGRGYRLEDLHAVQSLAAAAGFVSVLVFVLYLNSEAIKALYTQPTALWSVGLILIFWIGRIVVIAGRGEMHDDPVVFAVRDTTSLIAGVLVFLVLILSI